MKTFKFTRPLLGVLIFSLCLSCNKEKKDKKSSESNMEMTAKSTPMEFEIVENYFTKNDMTPRVVQYFIIDNKENLDKQFAAAKTMNNSITIIDFKKNRNVEIVMKITDVKKS